MAVVCGLSAADGWAGAFLRIFGAEDGGEFLSLGLGGFAVAGGHGGCFFEVEVVEELGGAFGGCFFEIGRVDKHAAAKFADVVSAERHVLGDVEPVGEGVSGWGEQERGSALPEIEVVD